MMKMRKHKVNKVRCSRQGWVDNGAWAYYNRRFELSILKVRAERKAYMDAWRASQEADKE
jgi:hypothetical protein